MELTEEEKESIYNSEKQKYDGTSWGVELEYHKETFISGIDALLEYINKKL